MTGSPNRASASSSTGACGDNANLDEYVVAFDVVGENLGVKEEALQFELKK